tara:strand:- start:918 stop:1199 length:282 start_codon:yes stop_codon:yes gene_type:complete
MRPEISLAAREIVVFTKSRKGMFFFFLERPQRENPGVIILQISGSFEAVLFIELHCIPIPHLQMNGMRTGEFPIKYNTKLIAAVQTRRWSFDT